MTIRILIFLGFTTILAQGFIDIATAEIPRFNWSRDGKVIHGGPAMPTKAVGDTINLMAAGNDPTNGPGEPAYFGDFESPGGDPDWNGWTSVDHTQITEKHWNISNYLEDDPGNFVALCGDIEIPACPNNTGDVPGGYGNIWNDNLGFSMTVPHPDEPTTVHLTGRYHVDTEPGYDYLHLDVYSLGEGSTRIRSWDAVKSGDIDETIVFQPADYENGSEVTIYFRFLSDWEGSDEDCFWDSILGAARLDDLAVQLVNGPTTLESYTDFQDGTFGDWAPVSPPGVGDFAKVWTGLQDLDPCGNNFTPQAAFIDDGIVVPGTGGSECINWCYGPGGYIVNTTGGLWSGLGEMHLNNSIQSPVMVWPDDTLDGARLSFDVYVHEDLTADAPGIFYLWGVRSADTDDSAGHGSQVLEEQRWADYSFLLYGGPEYRRHQEDVSYLMNPGRDEVQVRMNVYELGWVWGWVGNDGYPAPYFDNVKFQVHDFEGPAMHAREIDLANDGFPERESIEFQDLGSMSVRFDMASNISPRTHLNVDFGDSIVVNIEPVRSGAQLHGIPELHYRLRSNPVFDAHRSSGLPLEGSVPGFTPPSADQPGDSGLPAATAPTGWYFDLPDTGFLFPGDVLYYYLRAQDAIGGVDIRTAIMPADTSGFSSNPGDPLAYDQSFTVRALPTILDDGFGGFETPPILFWNDYGEHGSDVTWHSALRQSGLKPGVDYDVYDTNGPSSGVGNGLGGRAGSDLVLEHYTEMFYSAGDLAAYTISNGDYNKDPSDDVGVLAGWLHQGNKDIFLTGDNLVSDMAANGGPLTLAFVEDFLGLSYQQNDVRPFINNQMSPLVKATAGNPVFQNASDWVAFGGCPGINSFDAVGVAEGALRLAQFTDPGGEADVYTYSAGTLMIPDVPGTSRIVSLPYDFTNIRTPLEGNGAAPLATRVVLLRDVISYFGLPLTGVTDALVPDLVFTAANHPNPFNPVTKIVYTVPKAGHLSLKVYDIRGRLVRTLVDDQVAAGSDQVAVWNGTDEGGAAVSSGVYFYEARTGGEVKVGKMALVK